MDRVSAWTYLCTSAGLYRQGTQSGGVAPTPITAGWLNAVQEELISVIGAAGIELNSDDSTQVLQAIQYLLSESAKLFLPLAGGELTGLLKASRGVRVAKGLPAAGNVSLAGYAFGGDGDTGLFAVGGTDPDGSDLVLLIDGVELLRVKKSNGSVVLAGGLVLSGDKTTYNTGNKDEMLSVVYPVGSIYMNSSNGANPATYLGFGTWDALAPGRVLLGAGTGTDARGVAKAFDGGASGGEYDHVLDVTEMPEHSHTMPQGHIVPDGTTGPIYTSGDDYTRVPYGSDEPSTGDAGGGEAHNNIQPYLVVYMWQRTS